MCRKLTYLISFVLVLCLAGSAPAGLVAHWTFDETTGTVAHDSSGNGRDGTLNGGPLWVPGRIGGALQFDGSNDYVAAPYIPLNSRSFTVAMWVNAVLYTNEQIVFSQRQTSATNTDMHFRLGGPNIGSGNVPPRGVRMGFYSNDLDTAGGLIQDNKWYHITFWYDSANQNRRIYVNGVQQAQAAATAYLGTSGNTVIGSWAGASQWFRGIIDDVRVYDHALSAAEIKELIPPQLKAFEPNPPDGTIGVVTPLLQWKAGDTAAQHDVYFGTNPDALEFRVRYPRVQTVYYHQAGLTPGTTYYWRIDEIEADGTTVHTGDVWSFTVPSLKAWQPSPADGAKWIPSDATLAWNAGWGSIYYQVYLSADLDAVTNGTAEADKGQVGSTSYNAEDLALDTTYYWRVDSFNGTIWYTGDVWSFTTLSPMAGVKAQYYHHPGTTPPSPPQSAFQTLVLTRVDPAINFNWGDGSPDPSVNVDDFSVKWVAELEVPVSDTYTLWTNTDDGVMMWFDGQLVIDNWTDHGSTFDSSPAMALTAGDTHSIEMWWYERGGGAVAELHWSTPTMSRRPIPAGPLSLPLKASRPNPPNGAVDVKDAPTLRWSAGEEAAKHNVYFGSDATAVANATTATAGVYRGQQNLDVTSYTPSEAPLAWDTTYYWRIDEVNGVDLWKGTLWSFTTANFIVVDDFEDYDDWCNRVFYKWTDGWGYSADPTCGVVASGGNGTGSTVGNLNPPFAEQTIVHSGGQSMPFEYDNSGAAGKARYSETLRQWASPQDWTKNNVKALTLYVRGNPPDFIESPPGTFMMSAEGTDIWGGTDEFRYVYKQLSGNGEIIARVDRIAGPGTNEWAKAGVMIRETLVGTSKHAFMAVTPLASHGLAFQYRDGIDADDSDSEHGVDNQTAPYWVKLVRQGNVFTGYHSPDGINWTMKDPSGTETDAMNPVTIPMAANVYIGLALTSHENDVLRMAQFSNVSTSGSVTGAWTVIDIDSTVTGTNDAEPLYVALEDSAGKVKAVPSDNPLGSADPDWRQWNIKLSDFSGAAVNLKAVKKMYIGVGTRGSTMVGGSGKIYVDDIRVYPSRCVPSFGKLANDLSGNCVVDYADLEIMANDWLASGAGLAGDLNADGDVDFADYAALADSWLDELLWP